MGTTSSRTSARADRLPSIASIHSTIASPESSVRSPRDVASEIVSTATRMDVPRPRMSSEMGRVLVEGWSRDRGGDTLAADLDLEGGAGLRAADGEIARTDGNPQRGA